VTTTGTVDDAVASAVRVAADRRGQTVFIGIDGCGASGKTTVAGRMAAAVPDAVVVHVDDFAAPTIPQWDWDRMEAQLLGPLREGRDARYQRWDWDRDEGAEWHDVPAGIPVVIEGVSSTRREVNAPWALQIWVEAPRDARLDRAVHRDGPAQLQQWLDDWMPSEDAYVAREQPQDRVDLVVSGIRDEITVRPATEDDLERLDRDVPTPSVGIWAAHLARQAEGSIVFLVAWLGDRPIGTGLLDWRGSREANAAAGYPGVPAISNLHVHRPFQGHGAGSALIAAAEQIAAVRGHARVVIGVGLDNPGAARLYLRVGYRRTGIEDESRYSWTDATGAVHDEVEHVELLVKDVAVTSAPPGLGGSNPP
jgi:uridine kinase/GNAT superfamily N-acetyltransferase